MKKKKIVNMRKSLILENDSLRKVITDKVNE